MKRPLSEKEVAILRAVAAGHTYAETGRLLHVSPNTVKRHVARILDATGTRNRAHAVAVAYQAGILP